MAQERESSADEAERWTSEEVRERIVETLRLDLVGPPPGHELATECLPGRYFPSTWYLTGFLIPSDTPPEAAADPDEDEEFEEAEGAPGLPEENTDEPRTAKRSPFPSSMGLSFLVAPSARSLLVSVRWGDYAFEANASEDASTSKGVWRRTPMGDELIIELGEIGDQPRSYPLPASKGLEIVAVGRAVDAEAMLGQVAPETRSVSLFLVNRRAHAPDLPDTLYAFQPELLVRCEVPFVPRPNLRGLVSGNWDERVLDLHYADTPEYATGHGIAADWTVVEDTCREVRTTWIPSADVPRTEAVAVPDLTLSMRALAALPDGAAMQTALMPIVTHYRQWMERQRAGAEALLGPRRETALQLLQQTADAALRIERGVQILADSKDAAEAFRVANRAVSAALEKRFQASAQGDGPSWRPFQLAFMLLNLNGLVDPRHVDRETVDLLFFPTGGGKTEAYLGLAAIAMVLRRLRHRGDAGAGVCVMMRYTLRLLTLDQLGRAAGLMCALELERERDPTRLGNWPFEIGLWVGKAATPNVMGKKGDKRTDTARSKTISFKNNSEKSPPIPLESCPWCGERFTADSFDLQQDGRSNADTPNELRIVCVRPSCEFSGRRAAGLPILAVDEQIYRRLPAFLIATVDKFASLPWIGAAGVLLGGAERRDARGFYGPATPKIGQRLDLPLDPLDLVIQDELHLISGPLGTMAGLYETAIDALSSRVDGKRRIRPKIVASTATVRRAQDQVQALFDRHQTQIFPPPGPNRRDSFFARSVPPSETPARRYLGIAAQGRNPKLVLRRTWIALMSAAQDAFIRSGGYDRVDNPADPYMTVLGYFNSLRELGGARRILEEEVRSTVRAYGGRQRVSPHTRLFRDRDAWNEVVELTSRVSTSDVAAAKQRLEASFADRKQRVDCAIATNMISVGLDITRLGLMLVFGQPKSHSEYIQATSRVGRDRNKPGLVVTLLNIHKPRDRSHYERFRSYHETFYRAVESASVTPFSARALDRGLSGALVALARHLKPALTPATGPAAIAHEGTEIETMLQEIFRKRLLGQSFGDEGERAQRLQSVHDRIAGLLEAWKHVVAQDKEKGITTLYQQYEPGNSAKGQPLLRDVLNKDPGDDHHKMFRVHRSLRDVEPEVNLYLLRSDGRPLEDS